jgi:hypothetical protein
MMTSEELKLPSALRWGLARGGSTSLILLIAQALQLPAAR